MTAFNSLKNPFRITRIEVSHQERSDSLRADMRELARRVQNLDWLTTKTENTLDQMRNEVEGIRLAVDDSGSMSSILKDFNQY